jgi:hypothetical protein
VITRAHQVRAAATAAGVHPVMLALHQDRGRLTVVISTVPGRDTRQRPSKTAGCWHHGAVLISPARRTRTWPDPHTGPGCPCVRSCHLSAEFLLMASTARVKARSDSAATLPPYQWVACHASGSFFRTARVFPHGDRGGPRGRAIDLRTHLPG